MKRVLRRDSNCLFNHFLHSNREHGQEKTVSLFTKYEPRNETNKYIKIFLKVCEYGSLCFSEASDVLQYNVFSLFCVHHVNSNCQSALAEHQSV